MTKPVNHRTCRACGGAITKPGHHAYCSDKCRTCSVEECTKAHEAKGYCNSHYNNWKNTGSPIRLCRTCGGTITGRGLHVFCSDECRPECSFNDCHKPVRGTGPLCDVHRVQLETTGVLKPSRVKSSQVQQLSKAGLLKPPRWGTRGPCRICGEPCTMKNRREYCSEACKRIGQKPDRPKYFICARCGLEVDLMAKTRNGKRQRSDSRLCPSCKKRPRWAALSVRQLANRDGNTCKVCDFEVNMNVTGKIDAAPSIDHIVPRSFGGTDDADNLQLAHLWCNQIKNARTGPSGFGPSRLRYAATLAG